ncbi:MAG TPA: LacI family DNA-binding transcriptional regulator, partial [Thermomicrobiales bacterium]|nr:LacI family DNA-binding transcriptional regulator [Thermomicrobiales bacterium]
MDERSRSGQVTIRDVAQLAGVSTATVSKVLNNAPHVSDSAKERVHLAIGKLGYRPNAVARSLKAKRTRTIGLITDDLEGVFTASMMRGVEEATNQQGLSVLLCNSYGAHDRERAHLAVLLDKQVDGIILMSGYRVRERAAPALDTHHVPIVFLYHYTQDVRVPCVIPDDYGGGWLGASHLASNGRTRIGLINGPPHYEATYHRHRGVVDALREAGLVLDPTLVRSGKWDETHGYLMARELVSLSNPPDAIFCMSDSLASGALDALLELGIKVPGQIAVVGFDNRHFAAHQHPPLTTVALPLREMGRLAGELLMA